MVNSETIIIPRVLISFCKMKITTITTKKKMKGKNVLAVLSYPLLAVATQSFFVLPKDLFDNQSDKYKMAVILKNSDGWNSLPPILIQREAPKSLVPKNGKKTIANKNKFTTKSQGAIFFKTCSGSL